MAEGRNKLQKGRKEGWRENMYEHLHVHRGREKGSTWRKGNAHPPCHTGCHRDRERERHTHKEGNIYPERKKEGEVIWMQVIVMWKGNTISPAEKILAIPLEYFPNLLP